MKPKIWMNGKLFSWKSAKVHLLTHALHYGTAIFEGMRCYKTVDGPAVFRMKDHFKRLINGTKAYQFNLDYSLAELCRITKQLIMKNKLKECYLRPICFAGYKNIGIDIRGAPFNLAIIPIRMGKFFGKKAESGVSCEVSSWKRIDSTILFPHVKASANYLNSVLAKREALDAGYDEAILLSEEGHVSEASGENIFIVQKNELVTPPLYDGILAGVTRESIIEIAKELGIVVKERSILRDELYTADEVFLCGTAAEVTPVISIDKRRIGNSRPGSLTTALREAFFTIVSGRDQRYLSWLDFVKEE